MMVQGFKTKGFSLIQSQDMATKAMDRIVTKQAMILSYNDIFWLVGLFMLCCIPLCLYRNSTRKWIFLQQTSIKMNQKLEKCVREGRRGLFSLECPPSDTLF